MRGGLEEISRGLRVVASRMPCRIPSLSQIGELVRYGAASAIAFAADFGTLILLTELAGTHYLTAAAIGFIVGVVIAYLLSIRWVFAARRLTSVTAERTIFVLIGIAGLLINHVVMLALTEGTMLPYALSKVGSAALVFTFNFGLRKSVLFRVAVAPKG